MHVHTSLCILIPQYWTCLEMSNTIDARSTSYAHKTMHFTGAYAMVILIKFLSIEPFTGYTYGHACVEIHNHIS